MNIIDTIIDNTSGIWR